ncbi:ABC transporter substrate-binding protein [Paenibacillus sp. MBLB4367]|uniref:ABC transporter substrate-binding protein n=1 Tax=Paenibacillus sp. MBLB4367 TaxID=3384767 RepID=UPI003907E798
MKKRWRLPLLMALVITATACSSKDGSTNGETDASAPVSGDKKTVTVSVTNTDRLLQTAVRKFEEKHPDIHIEIKEHLATPKSDNGMTATRSQADIEKYIQTVTTQAISGKGSDLIEMNELPQDKFVKNGVLVNLYDMMAKDASFDKNKYYQNIFKSSQNGDGLYAMPFFFTVDLISGNTGMLQKANITIDDKTWTWDAFKDISKKLKENAGTDFYAFVNMFPIQLLNEYIEDNYSELVRNGKANFDSELFRAMMKQVKSMYDEGVLQAEFTYDYSKGLFSKSGLYNPEQALTDSLRENTQFYRAPSLNGKTQSGTFKAFFNLGINTKSKVQPEAWAFIKFLLSDEMQSSPELKYIPINKGVTDNKLKEAGDKIVKGSLPVPNGKTDAKSVEDRTLTIQKLLDGAGKKLGSDFKVVSIAMEEFESFMSGQKSAEDVSKLIQNRVNTYLNE